MPNIKLILSYDGSKYFGWQKTSIERPSIEGELERAALQIFGSPISDAARDQLLNHVLYKGHENSTAF